MNSQYNIYKELIEDHLKDFLPNVDQKSITLLESMEYSLMSGGKRLRPVLLLAACDFCGGNINSALPYAARHSPPWGSLVPWRRRATPFPPP